MSFSSCDLQHLSRKISSLLLLISILISPLNSLSTQAQTRFIYPVLILTTPTQSLVLGESTNFTLTIQRNGYTGPINNLTPYATYDLQNRDASCCYSFVISPTTTQDIYTMSMTPKPGVLGPNGGLNIVIYANIVLPPNTSASAVVVTNQVVKIIIKYPKVTITDSASADITNNTTPIDVLVGEQIKLSAQVSDLPLGTTTAPAGTWNVPGSQAFFPFAIAGYSPTPTNSNPTNSGFPTTLTTQNLANKNLTFYWVAANNPPPASGEGLQAVSYTVNISGTNFSGSVTYNIKRPKATILATKVGTVTIGPYLSQDSLGNCNVTKYNVALKFGDFCDGKTGVNFKQQGVDAPSGTYNWIQVLNLQTESATVQPPPGAKSATISPVTVSAAVDAPVANQIYYRSAFVKSTERSASADDSPASGIGAFKTFNRSDSFSTWLIYQSSKANSILVPIQKFDWSWSGSATSKDGTNGNFDPSSNAGTASVGSPSDTIFYPSWSSNAYAQNQIPFQGTIISGVSGGSSSGDIALGSVIKITGTGLSSTSSVLFNGSIIAIYSIISDTEIQVSVPENLPLGDATFTITRSDGVSISLGITVVVGGYPNVTSFTPTSGYANTSVTITGNGFSSATAVQFNGTLSTSYTVASNTQIIATVPNGATAGPISVTNGFGSGISNTAYQVIPPLDVYGVIEDSSLLVLKNLVQYYSGYPTPPPGSAGSPRNPANRYNITPASRNTTVDCFTGKASCPTGP
jgi:hypothetical protein